MLNIYYYNTIIRDIDIWIASDKDGIISIGLNQCLEEFTKDITKDFGHCLFLEDYSANEDAISQLQEYFNQERTKFSVPIKYIGTEFQKSVWSELISIPYGSVATYKDIAIRVNNEKAFRAVGMANNKNRLPIIVPCHRVIGSKGKLVGYAGGLELKKKLLEIEGIKIDYDRIIF